MVRYLLNWAICVFGAVFGFMAQAVVVPAPMRPQVTPWVRIDNSMSRLQLGNHSKYAAFTDEAGGNLRVINLKTKMVVAVDSGYVGASFFWAPDGVRLFYRRMSLEPAMKSTEHRKMRSQNLRSSSSRSSSTSGKSLSELMVFDAKLAKAFTLETLHQATGFLTFDPRDLRMYLMQEKGILSKRLDFPDERLAKWQIAHRKDSGKWLANQTGMVWVSQGGFAIRKLTDDGSGMGSFTISPDGSSAAWATAKGNIFVSKQGAAPELIDRGLDPTWHPDKPLLLYAGARIVGEKVLNYNLKVNDLKGSTRFLTTSQFASERWPQWHAEGTRIVYTMEKTTDLFLMDFLP